MKFKVGDTVRILAGHRTNTKGVITSIAKHGYLVGFEDIESLHYMDHELELVSRQDCTCESYEYPEGYGDEWEPDVESEPIPFPEYDDIEGNEYLFDPNEAYLYDEDELIITPVGDGDRVLFQVEHCAGGEIIPTWDDDLTMPQLIELQEYIEHTLGQILARKSLERDLEDETDN